MANFRLTGSSFSGSCSRVFTISYIERHVYFPGKGRKEWGGGGGFGLMFAGYVPLASENPYRVMVYSVGNYRPHLSHFWAKLAKMCNFRYPNF